VRRWAAHLGAPEAIVAKSPTADLEDLRPGLPDEEALGISYQAIDDYLEGLPVPADVAPATLEELRGAGPLEVPVEPP